MKNVLLLLLTFLSFSLYSCNKAGSQDCPKNSIDHVVFIGIDGWDAVSYDSAQIPTIKSMQLAGAWTLNKQSVFPSSSAPNWATIFNGSGVEQHGYTQWGSKKPEFETVYHTENGIYPTFFTAIRNKNASAQLGCLYEWETIKCLIDSTSVDYVQLAEPKTELCEKAVQYIREKKPTACAIIFDQLDHVGHESGWDTDDYFATLAEIDSYVASIVNATKEAGIFERTVFIISSDHGGIDKGHGGFTINEMRTPMIIYGPGIACGEIKTPVMQYDIAPTILYLLDVDQPASWIGRPVLCTSSCCKRL